MDRVTVSTTFFKPTDRFMFCLGSPSSVKDKMTQETVDSKKQISLKWTASQCNSVLLDVKIITG